MGSLQDFIGLITQLGVTGLLAGWLYLERSERMALQRERDALLERVLKGMNDTAVGMSAARDSINVSSGTLSTISNTLNTLKELLLMRGGQS